VIALAAKIHEEPAGKYEVGIRSGDTVFIRATGAKGAEVELELTPNQALRMATLLIEACDNARRPS
jgi:hypothetical protein